MCRSFLRLRPVLHGADPSIIPENQKNGEKPAESEPLWWLWKEGSVTPRTLRGKAQVSFLDEGHEKSQEQSRLGPFGKVRGILPAAARKHFRLKRFSDFL